MKELDENLDLLDLEEDTGLESLPEASPFASHPRPKKPWLLLGVGILIIALATYIIVRSVGSDSDSSMEVDLGTPEEVDSSAENTGSNLEMPENAAPVAPQPVSVQPTVVAPTPVAAAPVVTPQPAAKPAIVQKNETAGVPVREVADRREVKFNPKAASTEPKVVKPIAKKVIKSKTVTSASGGYYVQFGSYGTRAAAETAQNKIRANHSGLFEGKQFVILAAVLPNGSTTYRLRIAFAGSAEANGFCRNAKSDGLECYVAK